MPANGWATGKYGIARRYSYFLNSLTGKFNKIQEQLIGFIIFAMC